MVSLEGFKTNGFSRDRRGPFRKGLHLHKDPPSSTSQETIVLKDKPGRVQLICFDNKLDGVICVYLL